MLCVSHTGTLNMEVCPQTRYSLLTLLSSLNVNQDCVCVVKSNVTKFKVCIIRNSLCLGEHQAEPFLILKIKI